MAQVQSEATNTEPGQDMLRNGHAKADNAPAIPTDTNRLEAGSEMKAEDSSVPMAPDGGWGWMIVLGTFLIHVICDGIVYSFGVFVEDFVDYFECSKSAVGGVASLLLGVRWGSGVYISLRPIVVVDLLGLENFSIAFAFLRCFQGVGALAGPPLAGWLYDISNSYDNSFYMAGIGLIISGAMLYPIPCIQRRRLSHDNMVTASNLTVADSPGPSCNLPDASRVPDSTEIVPESSVNVEITRLRM